MLRCLPCRLVCMCWFIFLTLRGWRGEPQHACWASTALLCFCLSFVHAFNNRERETGEGGREKEERHCRELLADRNRHSQTPVMQSSCAQSQTYNVKVNMKSKSYFNIPCLIVHDLLVHVITNKTVYLHNILSKCNNLIHLSFLPVNLSPTNRLACYTHLTQSNQFSMDTII